MKKDFGSQVQGMLLLNQLLSPNPKSSINSLRIYPVGMARRLEEAYRNSTGDICADLRMKFAMDLKLSDKELFERYPLNDLFLDGKLHECFFYMYQHCSLNVPDSWVDTMANFNRDLQMAVS